MICTTPRPGRGRAVAVGLVLALLAAACTTRRTAPPRPDDSIPAGEGNRPWYAGTPEMRSDLEALIARLPTTQGAERVALGRRIVAYGEPAVPQLLATLDAPDPQLRGAGAWLLGFLKDPRSAARLVGALDDPVAYVRYEAAASLLKLGDDRGLPIVIDGLEAPDAMVRSKCIILLEEVTGEDLGYRADLAPDERAAAVARWRAWAAGRVGRAE